jgi:hypothetical protein
MSSVIEYQDESQKGSYYCNNCGSQIMVGTVHWHPSNAQARIMKVALKEYSDKRAHEEWKKREDSGYF